MKVGDLVKNTHALDRREVGLIVKVDQPSVDDWRCGYLVRWCDNGIPEESWNSERWLEILDESR